MRAPPGRPPVPPADPARGSRPRPLATYVAQFAEAEGFAHGHFHVVPRTADLPAELRGPRVFGLLRQPEHLLVPDGTRDEIVRALHDRLRPGPPAP